MLVVMGRFLWFYVPSLLLQPPTNQPAHLASLSARLPARPLINLDEEAKNTPPAPPGCQLRVKICDRGTSAPSPPDTH